jgi:hypothetical protein
MPCWAGDDVPAGALRTRSLLRRAERCGRSSPIRAATGPASLVDSLSGPHPTIVTTRLPGTASVSSVFIDGAPGERIRGSYGEGRLARNLHFVRICPLWSMLRATSGLGHPWVMDKQHAGRMISSRQKVTL